MSYHTTTVLQYFKRYLNKFLPKEVKGGIKILKFYGPIGLIVLVGLLTLAIYINPIPPKTAFLATGQEGSSYKNISEKFQNFFKEKGINLELAPTSGLGEGLKGLDSDSSEISASFLTAGVTSAKEYPNLVSLGSVQYAPIWIFYKGNIVKTNDPFEYFSTKKMAIGPAGNITNKIFRNLYELNQKSSPNPKNVVELPFKEAANELISGKVDAVFIIDNYQSESIQKLLASKDIKIMNFPLADAYLKQLPFLQKLVIPKGSINLESVYPSEDITILASTTSLLVEKSMHPAIQWAYLLSAQELGSSSNSFFAKSGYFPINLDQSFPLSPIAKRFYQHGAPSVFSYLPLWMASLIENIWAYILAFFIIIYPAYKLLGSARMFPAEHLMNEMFVNLRELDEAIPQATSSEQIDLILETLKAYENEIYETWLYEKNSRFYFNLRNAVAGIKRDAQAKLGTLSDAKP
jgi:TRAP-type uncharacterized transport system substrate-binding protein